MTSERNLDILRRRQAGEMLKSIAEHHGISAARVHQIVSRADIREPSIPVVRSREGGSIPPIVEGRPDWSYPDEITLRIVREIRAEMERVSGASPRVTGLSFFR